MSPAANRPSRSHDLYKSERIFYPSDDSLLPGPWSTGTEGGRAPGRGGAVLASPVPNNSDIDIFVGGTPANETIANLFCRDASSAGSLWGLSDPADWDWQGFREMSYLPASWRLTPKTAFSLPCSSYTASPPRPNLGTRGKVR